MRLAAIVFRSPPDGQPALLEVKALARSVLGGMLLLVLAVWLLTPAGFMPAFDHGAVTIAVCPDADGGATWAAGGHHHHGGHSGTAHQPCPFASGTGAGSLTPNVAPILEAMPVGPAVLVGRTFQLPERGRAHERPPLRGPPLPA
jgi:hypothetical protein